MRSPAQPRPPAREPSSTSSTHTYDDPIRRRARPRPLAGTGAMGLRRSPWRRLRALSSMTAPRRAGLIRQNIESLGVGAPTPCPPRDATRWAAPPRRPVRPRLLRPALRPRPRPPGLPPARPALARSRRAGGRREAQGVDGRAAGGFGELERRDYWETRCCSAASGTLAPQAGSSAARTAARYPRAQLDIGRPAVVALAESGVASISRSSAFISPA